ncbi:coiled-coil domain-containing protein 17 isoform X1 [Rhinichthys klamathensis goyatoka]|uniref:coiled-coil domain-containing protein 17 isoform X1 n=1 Tax=Rhinichthys klamathensis goyatoka TaxID=3034132 RepID=UPI0024B586B2|nr:coiled-coil domain-containing protein 17 isoform X1 [Rhinichthys klamathensis goyatoka]
MEGLGQFICQNCNMAFHSAGLLDKHKAKFCIGTDLKDPIALWRGQRGFTQTENAALKTVHPKRARTPDLIVLKEQRKCQVDQRESSQENTALNKLTEEFRKLRISFEHNQPRRQTEVSEEQGSLQQKADEQRAIDLYKDHEQRLAEIRARNHQLEKEREDIEQRLAELGGRERTAHLEEVLQELRSQEQRNEEVLHQLSSHINSMKGFNQNEVQSNPPEEKKTHVLICSVDGPLSAQIRALRLAYMQSGGSDPEVLAHMHDLQAEAHTLEQARPRADGKTKGRRMKSPHRVLDPDVLAVEQENQKLEEEILRIQLARERHKGEHGLIDIQKDHIHQMASLQAEISFLKREIDKRRDRRPHHPMFPGSSMAHSHSALTLDQSSKQHSLMGSHVTDPMEPLGPAPYDPVAGFVIFYDLVMGLEATLRSVRLLEGLYCNGEKLGHTTPMPPVQCQPLLSTKSPGNYAILAVKQPVPRVQPSPNLTLVLEIQTSRGLHLYNYETKDLVTCGWAKLELFDEHNQVHSGHWRLPFRSLPVQASLSPVQLNSVSQLGNMELCLRVANACHGDVQTLAKIDINNTNQYKYPSMVVSNTSAILATQEPSHTLQPSTNPLPSSLPQTDHVEESNYI